MCPQARVFQPTTPRPTTTYRTPAAPTLRPHLGKAMKAVGITQLKRQHRFHIFRNSAGTLIYSKSRDLKPEFSRCAPRFLEAARADMYFVLFALLLETGLRPSECFLMSFAL